MDVNMCMQGTGGVDPAFQAPSESIPQKPTESPLWEVFYLEGQSRRVYETEGICVRVCA